MKTKQPTWFKLTIVSVSLGILSLLFFLTASINAQIGSENDQFAFLPLILRPTGEASIPTPSSTPAPTLTLQPTPAMSPTPTGETETPSSTTTPKTTDVKNFIFGHSLIVHATDSDETTVPHWVHAFAQEAGYTYAVDGQYGFLPQHANLPPNAQWGFAGVPGVWDAESGEEFSEVDFTTILLTAGNFIQYQPATVPYDGDNPDNTTPLGATLDIIDWVIEQEPGIDIYIYENWPDMAPYLSNGFPPTAEEFAAYNAYVENDFHAWWVDYLDEITKARPDANVKMIPVGPIITTLLTESELNQIPITELYEDDAPHGEPTLYFLAGLITYMDIYGEKAPADFEIPSTVHPLVQNNYTDVVDDIWNELTNSNLSKR
ncbi:MAG: T9SS C-terminal target domain-containing protein [Anaerolineae bacterium]